MLSIAKAYFYKILYNNLLTNDWKKFSKQSEFIFFHKFLLYIPCIYYVLDVFINAVPKMYKNKIKIEHIIWTSLKTK